MFFNRREFLTLAVVMAGTLGINGASRFHTSGAAAVSAMPSPAMNTLQTQLQPGDIVLLRRRSLSINAWVPGYWSHVALYVGSVGELKKLGLDHDPRVATHLGAFAESGAGGQPHVMIEALLEGVRFHSLSGSLQSTEAVAVLRPRLQPEQINEAIARAFTHAGKPFDLDFDFEHDDKLACTELVYRAYEGVLSLQFSDAMGRRVITPTEFARTFGSERLTSSQQFDLVLFIDGSVFSAEARPGQPDAFVETTRRPAVDWPR